MRRNDMRRMTRSMMKRKIEQEHDREIRVDWIGAAIAAGSFLFLGGWILGVLTVTWMQ